MGYIIWLASYPKSGNTWLRAFLRNLSETGKPADINALHQHFPYDVGGAHYRAIDPRPCDQYSRAETIALRAEVQRRIAAERPVTLVKTHSALVVEGGHHLINPGVTAGAVYLVRNPLDIAVSFSFHTGKSLDATIDQMNLAGAVEPGGPHLAQEYFGSWSENVESWTRQPNPRIHVVRYEDMTAARVKTFSSIAKFLGLDVERAGIETALKKSSFRVLQTQEARHGFAERPETATAPFFRAGNVGDGARTLSSAQIERLAAAHHVQMERFGYLP